MIQRWLSFTPPAIPFSEWNSLHLLGRHLHLRRIAVLNMAVPELKDRKPGLMTLISLRSRSPVHLQPRGAIHRPGEGFFWELVTLKTSCSLGHWQEMPSVGQASGALNELAKLCPTRRSASITAT